uniref:ANK_REP_REGION domain-containing protein n=1 Tax=Panagrellus redivivus TaxID=6233 RepID=A0A7E4V1N9_PANRE
MSISSSLDDLSDSFSGSSMLTTIPNTSIAEPTPQTKGRSYGHALPGWVPDLGGDRYESLSSPRMTSFQTSANTTPQRRPPPQKTHVTPFHDSSVYMMNYDSIPPRPVTAQTIVLPNRIATVRNVNENVSGDTNNSPMPSRQQIAKPKTVKRQNSPIAFVQDDPTPAGFAVPTKASASVTSGTSNKADNHVFSKAIVIHTLKANGVHHATYYKCSYQSAESLECHEKNFAEWVLPNMSPRMPVLHWCVQTGAVTTMNLRTGASADDELLEFSKFRNRAGSQISRWDGVGDLSDPILYEQKSGLRQTDESSRAVTQVYRTEDELEYQRQIMRDFAPTVKLQASESSTSCPTFSDESTLRDESSSMDFMGGHDEPYYPPTNSKYAADYWLSLMTDNHPGQRMTAGRDVGGAVASDSTSTASSFCPDNYQKTDAPADPSAVMNDVVDLCDYLLSTLTTAPKPPSTYSSMPPPAASDTDPTPVAASSTSGTITSFPIYVKRDPR